jgi:branched-chain amino acid transport system permease protein
MPAILRDAAIAALVALALALPIVGVRTVDTGAVLGLDYRFGWAVAAAVIVFAGRFAALALYDRLPKGPRRIRTTGLASKSRAYVRYAAIGFIVFAAALPQLPFSDRYIVDTATQVLIYVMLGWGLNVVVGLAGLLDLGYVAFYAVGAYSYALLAKNFGLSFWECLPLAGAFAAFFGIMLGFPVLRLRGDYLAIVTLGFGEMIRILLINWTSLTGGPNGLTSIPRPDFFGLSFTRSPAAGERAFHEAFGLEFSTMHRITFLYYLILALALVTGWAVERMRRLPVGRAWEALREDEIACQSLGINRTTTKLTAFAIGASFGGFAGSFFSTRQGFISPESFTFIESATILAIVVLGGMGSQIGVVLAATVLVLLPEIFRDLAHYRMMVFGLAMVLIMVWRPTGFVTQRTPTVRLADYPAPGGGRGL